MDQIKIGRFIAERRKQNNFTQVQLAERLGITDRAVSKWERGKSMPDSSIMLDLCDALKINVNDLLCGEVVSVYNEKLEKNLLELVRQKEQSDKRLLWSEALMVILSIAFWTCLKLIAPLVQIPSWIMAIGYLQLIIISLFAIRIEQVAGYYQCTECGHRYIPTYSRVLFAKHLFRTRHMFCPKCGKLTWQKKVISLEEKNREGKNNE